MVKEQKDHMDQQKEKIQDMEGAYDKLVQKAYILNFADQVLKEQNPGQN